MESPVRIARISELEGQRLGPYEIVGMVGRGGMAVVYKALQPALRRHVAIKVLPPYFVHEEGFRVRFQQEAETVAHLEHPNILPIYDFGQEGDVPYIVMPLVTGGTLRDWLAKPVPLERALQVFSRILAALEYAHSQRVVHRDIKPTNILISQGDWPLLTDFGIAKIVEPSLRVTRSGTMIGTPEYMSPEQSQGDHVDHRADLYAMGIILYEMLTGRLPFQGQTPVAVILQHVRDAVPMPSSVNPALSPIWDDVIRLCLAKDANERYSSARVMDDAIQAAWQKVKRESGQWQTVGADPRVLYDSAQRALGDGDWQRVISLCGQLLEIDPAHPEAVHLLTQAHEALRRQRGESTGAPIAHLLEQAEAALAGERFAEAIGCYQAALESSPGSTAAQSGIYRAQQAQGLAVLYHGARADVAAEHWDAAAAKLDQLAATAPGYRDVNALREQVGAQQQRQARLAAWFDAGMAALGRRDWPAAVAALEQVVTAAPTYRDAAARLTEARQGAEVQAALAQARATLTAGHHADAVALLETIVGRAPGHAEAQTLLAQARAAATPRGTAARGYEGPPQVFATPPRADGPGGVLPAGARGAGNGTAPGAAVAYPPAGRAAGPAPTAAGYRGGSEAPPTTTGRRAAVAEPVATLGAVAPAAVPAYAMPDEGGGSKLKYILGSGLVALAIAGVVAWQRAPVVAIARGGGAVATATVAAPAATAVVPTAVPRPTAADLFPACQSAVAASAWADAVDACEKVQAEDANFAGVAEALATANVALGKDAVAQGAPLADALARFDQALAARPDDAEAEQQRAWAQSYQEGQAALAAESWPLATEKLDQVYTVAPDYRDGVDGGVKRALYRARLGWGDALLAAGSYADARDKCGDALKLVGGDDVAQACVAKANAALTPPTAVPAPAYVAPPAPAAPAGRTTSGSSGGAQSAAPSGQAPGVRAPAANTVPAAPAAPAAKPTFTPRY